MAGTHPERLAHLFLASADLPRGMNLYQDGRGGFVEQGDTAFQRHGGQFVGMAKWESLNGSNSPIKSVVDIRWLFPSDAAATRYHLETLHMKAEGKAPNVTAPKVGANCHVFSYPSGGDIGMANALFGQFFPGRDFSVRGPGESVEQGRPIDQHFAGLAHDGYIYLFTVGGVPVKLFVSLDERYVSAEQASREALVHALARRVEDRVSATKLGGTGQGGSGRPWWKRLFG